MALTCAEFLRRLDADVPPDGDTRAHLAACTGCRQALARWQAVAGEMHAWAEEPPPAFLHSRIMAGVRGERASARPGISAWLWRRPLWASSALAAAFVLVVAGVAVLRTPGVRAPQEEPAPASVAPAAPPSAEARAEQQQQERPASSRPARQAATPRLVESHDVPLLQDEGERLTESSSELPGAPQDLRRQKEALDFERKRADAAPAPAPPVEEQTRRATELAAGAPGGAVAESRAARPIPQARPVACRLAPLAGGPVRMVRLSLAALGDSAAYVDVDAAGWVRLEVDHTQQPASDAAATRKGRQRDAVRLQELALEEGDRVALEALSLPPGRYRLERIAE